MDETEIAEARQMRRYLAAAILGGVAGVASIIVAVIAELRWECWHSGQGCYDGQGGIVLIVLVPIMFVVGGIAGAFWTWLRNSKRSGRIVVLKEFETWN